MAKCKNCAHSGWLLSLDNNGLCLQCQQIHLPMIVNHCRIVADSDEIVSRTKNASTKLSRIDVAIHSLVELVPYDKKGIPTLIKRPEDIIAEFEGMRQAVISEEIQNQSFNARQKAQNAATDTGKLGGYAKAIEVLFNLMDDTQDVSELERAILSLRSERDALRVKLICQKAEIALAKGKDKRAVEILIEALMAMKHDETPDQEQIGIAEKIRDQIYKLGGELPSGI